MKKTIPTSISHTIFYIQEDAFEKLDTYLKEVREYFASFADSKDIIEDIESRIEEQLLDQSSKDKTDRIVTSSHVDVLIKSMGRPQEFEGGESDQTKPQANTTDSKPHKKLYRDKENAVIGGVASGLAQYFGVDPIIIRIIFFVSIFLGGFGVISYIFLWFAVPEAKTATQKLEMEGSPVTLDEVKKIIEEKVEEVKGHDGFKKSSEKFREFFIRISSLFFGTFGKFIGVIFGIIALAGTIVLVTGLIILVTTITPPIAGVSIVAFYGAMNILFLLLLIPILFIGLAGHMLLNIKRSSHKTLAGTLGLIWILAVIAATVIGFHVVQNRDLYRGTFVQGNMITTTPTISNFSNLILKNSQHVTVTIGDKTSIQITGSERDVNRIFLDQESDTLTIRNKDQLWSCFLCSIKPAQITITTPMIQNIEAKNSSTISLVGNVADLKIELENASRGFLNGTAKTLNASLKNASRLEAPKFIVSKLFINEENASWSTVNITDAISGKLSNASLLEQYGTASLTNLDLENGSRANGR